MAAVTDGAAGGGYGLADPQGQIGRQTHRLHTRPCRPPTRRCPPTRPTRLRARCSDEQHEQTLDEAARMAAVLAGGEDEKLFAIYEEVG